MYAFTDGLTGRWVEDSYVPVSGEVLFDHWPSEAEKDTAFPGYLLQSAKNQVLQSFWSSWYFALRENFQSDATGIMLTYWGDADNHADITHDALSSMLHADDPLWTGHALVVASTGEKTLITLTVAQVQGVFESLRAKRLAVNTHYSEKMSAVNAITDTSSVGVAAVNAITW